MLVLTCALLRLWLKVLSDSSPPSWRRGDIQAWLQCPLKLPRKSFKKKVISWYFVLYVNFLTFIYSLRGSIRYNLLRIMICLNKGPGLGLRCQSLNSGRYTLGDRLQQLVALLVYWRIFVKVFVSTTEFCRCKMLQKIKSDRICATCCGDKILLQCQRFVTKILLYTQSDLLLRGVVATCCLN